MPVVNDLEAGAPDDVSTPPFDPSLIQVLSMDEIFEKYCNDPAFVQYAAKKLGLVKV